MKQTKDAWVDQYSASHRNPINQAMHMVGIPMIASSIVLFFLSLEWSGLLAMATLLFLTGWILQFVGHAFEGKRPEFLNDWRFLFVGLRWWIRKMRELILRQI